MPQKAGSLGRPIKKVISSDLEPATEFPVLLCIHFLTSCVTSPLRLVSSTIKWAQQFLLLQVPARELKEVPNWQIERWQKKS